MDQAIDIDAVNNHGVAIATSLSSDRRPLLVMASLPIQVIHGTEDPILPHAHGGRIGRDNSRCRATDVGECGVRKSNLF